MFLFESEGILMMNTIKSFLFLAICAAFVQPLLALDYLIAKIVNGDVSSSYELKSNLSEAEVKAACSDSQMIFVKVGGVYISVFETLVSQAKAVGITEGVDYDSGKDAWSAEGFDGQLSAYLNSYVKPFGVAVRLPTAEEWLAAAANSPSGNMSEYPSTVGSGSVNPQGLYDCTGNAGEVCADGKTRSGTEVKELKEITPTWSKVWLGMRLVYDIQTPQVAVTIDGNSSSVDQGATITLEATGKANQRFVGWSLDAVVPENTTLALPVSNPGDLTLPNEVTSVTIASKWIDTYTFAVTQPETGVVAVEPTPVAGQRYDAGSTFTVTAQPPVGYAFGGWSVTTGGVLSTETANPLTITLAGDTSVVAAEWIKQASITVEGVAQWVTPGDTVTLTKPLLPGVAFQEWEASRVAPRDLDYTLPTTNPGDFTVPEGCESMTITAATQQASLFNLIGCSVTGTPAFPADHYLTPGTSINYTFETIVPAGYTVTWRYTSSSDFVATEEHGKLTMVGKVPIGDVTIYPTFSTNALDPVTYDLTQPTDPAFGLAIETTPQTTAIDDLTSVKSTPIAKQEGLYALLTRTVDEQDSTKVSYSLDYRRVDPATLLTDTLATFNQNNLVLKRPTADSDYYLSVYEASQGLLINLGVPYTTAAVANRANSQPIGNVSATHTTLLTKLNETFGKTAGALFALPTPDQFKEAAKLKEGETVSLGAGNFTKNLAVSGSNRTYVSPQGFYDLWGNGAEYCSDGKYYGLSVNQPNWPADPWAGLDPKYNALYTTLRPAIAVAQTHTVTLMGKPVTVLAGYALPALAEPVRKGYAFKGWAITPALPDGRIINADTTITAQWDATPAALATVTVVDDEYQVAVGQASTFVVPLVNDDGEYFSHWLIAGDEGVLAVTGALTDQVLSVTCKKGGNATLTPIYKSKKGLIFYFK